MCLSCVILVIVIYNFCIFSCIPVYSAVECNFIRIVYASGLNIQFVNFTCFN